MTTFAEMQFTDKVKEFIGSNALLEDGAHVIVGLSGGADSTALLKVLLALGYRCTAVHCNFHLRGPESDRDEKFATDLCNELGVKLIIRSYNTAEYAKKNGISIEMAARELRYADFEYTMRECKASAICIAHHRDDSVETVLLNLIRGTGIKGLTGIKPQNGNIIRPLLCVSRDEIEEWLNATGQTYVTDSTNLEADYTRNKIRLQLLPLMRSINPDVDNAINDTAKHLEQSYRIYQKGIEQARRRTTTFFDEDSFRIEIPRLLKTPSVQAVLFEALSPLGFNSTQIEAIAASAENPQPGKRFLAPKHELLIGNDVIFVHRIARADLQPIILGVEPGISIPLPEGGTITISTAPAGTPISKDPNTATFDASLLREGSIIIRRWSHGDWFIPFGMKGRKLISDYLTDSKVTLIERYAQLVATFNEDIIWVLGRRTDNRYRVTPGTKLQLILTLTGK